MVGSAFVLHLLVHKRSGIKTPQIEIRKLFNLVRDDVMAATGRRQQPYSYGSVPGNADFYFLQSTQVQAQAR
jgi:hypothetical protein